MKKFLTITLLALLSLGLFVACDPDVIGEIFSGEDEPGLPPAPVQQDPHFILNESNPDAIDVFTAPGIPSTQWAKSSTSDWPLVVIVKKSSDPNSCFVKCFCDGYWPKNMSAMAPATYHYDLGETDDVLFRMQIQCLNEQQGLCTVKFASSTITLRPASGGKRSDYVGTWEVKIGTGFNAREPGVDCELDNVFYSATIEIEN